MHLQIVRCPMCNDEVLYVVRNPRNQAIVREEYPRIVISLGPWVLHECDESWRAPARWRS